MSLIRVSEKKLAANRANARLSRGPSTPAGKERSSQNACKHHLYAKKYMLPPAWQARISQVVAPCAASVEDPAERAALIQYIVLKQWIIELFALETRLFNQSIARHRSIPRGIHRFATTDPLFHVIQSRMHSLQSQADRALIPWKRLSPKSSGKRTTPKLIENKPLAMAAAASAGAVEIGVHPNLRTSVLIRVPSKPEPPPHPNLINSKPIMGRFLSFLLLLLTLTACGALTSLEAQLR